jgi:predicted TIM-barrel fold metal-dependent hydrolase
VTPGRWVMRQLRRHKVSRVRLARFRPESTLRLPTSRIDRSAIPVIDVHGHLGRWLTHGTWMEPDVDATLRTMDGLNVETIVNLDGRWGAELEANLDRYDRKHPNRFVTFCHVDWSLLRSGGHGDLVRQLEMNAAAGARGIKVWKDLGLTLRDRRGRRIFHDDSRLAELWDACGELGLTVLVHAADPVAFFLPADLRNERLLEIRRHPPRAQQRGGLKLRNRILDGFLQTVTDHRRTVFIGAHLGGFAEDLGQLAAHLTSHENLYVDISARLSDLGRQPRAFRRLVSEHSGRVLFGSDVYPVRAAEYARYFRFLESDDEDFEYWADGTAPQGTWRISGAGLDSGPLRGLYRDNALALLAGARSDR